MPRPLRKTVRRAARRVRRAGRVLLTGEVAAPATAGPERPVARPAGSSGTAGSPGPRSAKETASPWLAPPGFAEVRADPETVVVILADASVRAAVPHWIEFFRAARLHLVSSEARPDWQLPGTEVVHHSGETLGQLNNVVRSIGRVDAIVDTRPLSVEDRLETFHRLFLYLRPRGRYVVDTRGGGAVIGSAAYAEWVATLIGSTDPAATASARDREFTASVRSVELSADLLVIEKERHHYVKLRDAEAAQVIQLREPEVSVEVLARRPGGKLSVASTITSHTAAVPIEALDTTMTYPPLQLRRYHGRFAVVSNALVHTGSTVLPESFRHHLEGPLRNPVLTSISATFGRIGENLRPRTVLPGSYYHLDAENSGHFGHLMTEVISRLWGWDVAKAADPDLKALFRIRYPGERDPELERTVLGAYGIAAEDIVWTDEPVWVENLVGATPMWHNQPPHSVHPGLTEVWRRLGDALIDPDAPVHRKMFVSRAEVTPNRSCRNTRAVEEFFAGLGFDVVYPEQWSLQQQAGMFARAEVVAGFGGSALFNIMFGRELKTLIVLNHEAYTARNEHLFSALLPLDVHYFWSTPDIQHPPGKWSSEAYYSSWEFDFDRNRSALEELAARL